MQELSPSQKQYEASLEEAYQGLINCNSPVAEGRKIGNYFRDLSSEKSKLIFFEYNMVAEGFPLFLLEVENFVANHYVNCIAKKQLDTSESDFLNYVVWKTWENKIFVLKFEKEEKKKRPRDTYLVYSNSETVKELVERKASKQGAYMASSYAKGVQSSLIEETSLLRDETKKDIASYYQSLCFNLETGTLTKQEIMKQGTALIQKVDKRLEERLPEITLSLNAQLANKLNEINILPMPEVKQITGEQ